MAFIEIEGLRHEYENPPLAALKVVDLEIHRGEYVAILGANGSGKSTLVRHLNGLLLPTKGTVKVSGMDTRTHTYPIREKIGMVFQSPDEQIVASVVEEDVAFGPENLGVPRDRMKQAVRRALERVGMYEYRDKPPHLLSAGQQQRVAVAGVLAMEPECLVFDEAGAMLDPGGRRDLGDILMDLHEEGRTIITVTHSMEEAREASRAVVMSDGEVVFDGTPGRIFEEPGIERWGLRLPDSLRLIEALKRYFPGFSVEAGSKRELPDLIAGELKRHLPNGGTTLISCNIDASHVDTVSQPTDSPNTFETSSPAVIFEKVTHRYLADTCLEYKALTDVSLRIPKHTCAALIGTTGSGKSTALQHCNALLFPKPGRVVTLGTDTTDPKADLRALRQHAGLALQRPETQLFERYVGDDVAYGPKQAGIEGLELTRRVRRAMETAGLPFGEFKDRPVHTLSGGEKRKAALAGVFALQPEILLLDEPTAGLDPAARESVINLIKTRLDEGITMLIATHDMEAVAVLADSVYVLAGGRLVDQGSRESVFYSRPLDTMGLTRPLAAAVWSAITGHFRMGNNHERGPVTVDQLIEFLRDTRMLKEPS